MTVWYKLISVGVVLLLFCTVVAGSCKSQNTPSRTAEDYNRVAMDVQRRNISNVDSIRYAISLLTKAIEIDSNFYAAHNNKIALFLSIGECQEAINAINKLQQLDTTYYLKVLKANVLESMGWRDSANKLYYEALTDYDRRIQIGHSDIKLMTDRIFLMLFLYPKDIVDQEVEKLNERYPNDKSVMFFKSIIMDFNRAEFIKSICHYRG